VEEFFHQMKTSLLPILQERPARLLAALYGGDPKGVHLSELARRQGMALTSAYNAVRRLEDAGLVESERIGRSRVVRPNPRSPYADDLRSLLTRAFGPPAVLRDALESVPGVVRAAIFGSWAARLAGARGPDPVDIDVLVVGRPDLVALDDVLRDAERLLGREVQPTVATVEEWEEAESAFLQTIKSRPLVWVMPDA
jgi:DNA-binding transcriptional ArsR family regulator